jgi:HAD superfamily hydrolase (TIGR01509 family)
MKYLCKDITNDCIKEISQEKNDLFIKLLNKNKNILFDGVLSFFEKNKHHNIAIVTSSNKKTTEYILKLTDLYKYVDLIIASEDTTKHKPYPDPYLKAIEQFDINIENIFIFEDSYSGYSSAKRTPVKNIALINNDESCQEIIDTPEFKYSDYNELKLSSITEFYLNLDNKCLDYNSQIKMNINTIPIKNVKKNDNNLKTGYICDINSYCINYVNGENENVVLKISNFNNELSNTAIKLNMYENERYFYDKISHLINNTPKFYGSFKDDLKDAIILEDLNRYPGSFNINLNTNIYTLLNVVNSIHNVHKTFYFESNDDIIPTMKSLKKINEISYFKNLIHERYKIFENNVKHILNDNEKIIINKIYNNIDKIFDEASCLPLCFCHGDLKSPNIFYKNNSEPILLDWQYIHLNKGVSDIVFLLIESIEFDKTNVDLVVNFYYKLQNEVHAIPYHTYMTDLKNALCIFPFFVCVWFNSESRDKLLDPVFPIRFIKNLMKYYNYYLQE